MITLTDVEAAAARIAGHVRRTPLLRASALRQPLTPADLHLKLESLQPTGSFKARGATNKLLATQPERLRAGVVAASGGNHGLAVARAGALAGVPATIFLPESVMPEKVAKIEAWGGTPVIGGNVFEEANRAALAFAEKTGAAYFHPFADPLVVAGQGTAALELLEDLPEVDVVVIAIGGGGFVAGAAVALKALKPSVRIIGVEPVGSPTLYNSLAAGEVVSLPKVTTSVPTMACLRTDERIFDIVRQHVDEIALVEDAAMQRAAEWLWFELGLAADLSGAAAVAALNEGKIRLAPGTRTCAFVCGAGTSGLG